MFKKPKCKLVPPPSAPTLDEIFADMETLHFETPAIVKTKAETTGTGGQDDDVESWWQQFIVFMSDLRDLSVVNSEINDYKLRLETNKIEIETESQEIKNTLHEQQNLVKTILEE